METKEEEDYSNKLFRKCNHYINDDIRSEWFDSVGNCNINYEQCHGNDKCHNLNFKSKKMIKEVKYYDIICDRCGKSLTKECDMCFPDTDSALMVAEQSEWNKIGSKHYCPDCYKLDEETDEYVPKKGGEEVKTIYCGECDNFLYEDTYGYGICGKTNDECRCSDKCHITNGKP